MAIVSNKPQTTRNRICAILNRGDAQFVFMDTPGLHKARTRLGGLYGQGRERERVRCGRRDAAGGAHPHVGGPEAELIGRIKELGVPSVLVINKLTP